MTQDRTNFRFADLNSRFAAFVIDWHIRTIPIALWGFWIFVEWLPAYWRTYWHRAGSGNAPLETAFEALRPVLDQPSVALIAWLCLLAYLIYHPLTELLLRGDSPGKIITGITVISVDGSRPTARQIVIRNLWRAVEFLPIAYLWGVWMIWRSPENVRTGDRQAGTRVVMRS